MKGIGIVKGGLKYLLILLSAMVLATLLMTLAYKVPISEEIRTASRAFQEAQGVSSEYPTLSSSAEPSFNTYLPGVFDGYTMNCELNVSFEEGYSSALERAMVPSYFRYWHGYAAILRPLLHFLDYEKIELLNCFLQFILLAYTAVLIGKQFSKRYLWLYFTSVVLLFFPVVGLCFQYSWVCWIGYGATAIYLSHTQFFEKDKNLFLLFFLSGIVTNFLDLLTYPLFTWGMPILWIILFRKDLKWLQALKTVVLTGLFWIAGYAGMWVSKWIVASLVLHINAFQDALYEAHNWTAGTLNPMLYRWIGLSRNLQHYQYTLYSLLLLVWLVWLVVMWQLKGWKKDSRVYALFLISCSSVVWYFTLYYHGYIHHIFTYRTANVGIIGVLSILTLSIEEGNEGFSIRRKGFAARAACTVCIALLGLGMERVSYEETSHYNWNYDIYHNSVMTLSDTVTLEFIPERSLINRFSFVVYPAYESQERSLTVTVKNEDGDTLYVTEASPETTSNVIAIADVKWKLHEGERYFIEISPNGDTNQATYVLSDEGQQPVEGITYLTESGELTASQPAVGITYFGRPFTTSGRHFYIGLWIGILFALFRLVYEKLPIRES